ncbi:MAG: hypothetical protein H6976_16335 [Gammaproteobacteria bacterium]|nr:hypothetical protein [Gammaproteobacteria bacterium]
MNEIKDQRRRDNAEAYAVGRLGRNRQSAMVKALQNMERAADTDATVSRETVVMDPVTTDPLSVQRSIPPKGNVLLILKSADLALGRPARFGNASFG